MEQRVLFICGFFPPAVNVQAHLNLATVLAFLDQGWSVTVVTSAPGVEASCDHSREWGERVEVVYADRGTADSLFGTVRAVVGAPQEGVVFTGSYPYMRQAVGNILPRRTYGLLYTVSSPGDNHRIGLELGRRVGVPWVAEFQDPWIENRTLSQWLMCNAHGLYRWVWRERVQRLIENVLRGATLVLTESVGHAEALRTRCLSLGINSAKVVPAYLSGDPRTSIPNSSSRLGELLRASPVPLIGFVGKVYYGYEERVRSLITCLREVERERRFLFLAVGCEQLGRLAREEGLRSSLAIQSVSYHEALSIMRCLDLGVVIPSSDININSKFFDYLRQGCPVLVWGCPDGEMGRLVVERDVGVAVRDSDPEGVAGAVCKELFLSREKRESRPVDLTWSTRGTELSPLFERLAGGLPRR